MVIIQRVSSTIKTAVYDALTAINYEPAKEKIFIKPNIVNPFLPDEPYITNPLVVAAIIDYLKNRGYHDIVVGEGPVGFEVKEIFEVCGYRQMCEEKKVGLVDLEKTKRIKINDIELPAYAIEREYINVAKLKTHLQTTVTLGLKNQKGLLKMKTKRIFHRDLHNNIVRLAQAITPDLTIIDALNGVEGNGPGRMGSEVKGLNLLLAGRNMLSVDMVGAALMGFDWQEVRHLKKAHEQGLGDYPKEVIGEQLAQVARKFKQPTNFQKFFNIYYWWTDTTCSGCSCLLGDMKVIALKNPYYLFRLFLNGFLRRLDLLTGHIINCPPNHGKVICIGECTRKIAQKHGFIWIKGCPPKPIDILKRI